MTLVWRALTPAKVATPAVAVRGFVVAVRPEATSVVHEASE
jgi:hypothetical protein